MPVKRLRIAFDIDVSVLATVLAQCNSGMHIELSGEEALTPLPSPAARPHYEQPALELFKKSKTVTTANMIILVERLGGNRKAATNLLYRLYRDGLVQRTRFGHYRLTAKGRSHAE